MSNAHPPPSCLRWGRSAYEQPEDLQREAAALQALGCTVRFESSPTPSLAGVEVLIVHSKKRIDANVFARANALKLVVATTSGTDHIDLHAAQRHGVRVARSPLARRDAVVECTLAMGLSLLRDLPHLQSRAKAGIWARKELPHRPIFTLRGLPVGVIGCGVIGQRAVEVWRALGAEVSIHDPAHPDSIPLEELLPKSHIISLHCSLNPTSRRLVDRNFLHEMRPGSILLNTARGGCIDIDALLEADHLGGVGLDVFPEEPWPNLASLASRPNFLITPHAAGFHQGLGDAIVHEVVTTIRQWFQADTLPHEVHPP